MDSKQENKVSMYNKVRAFFTTNQADYTDYPAILGKVTEFNDLLTRLLAKDGEATEDTKGFTEQKLNNKNELIVNSLPIIGAIKAWSSVSKDFGMRGIVDVTESALRKMRDTDLLVYCLRLKEITTTNLSSLLMYNVDAAFVANYNTTVKTYNDAIEVTGDKKATRVAAGIAVDTLIVEIDSMLKEVIDSLMLITAKAIPNSYQAYLNARSIVDNASGSSAPDFIVNLAPASYKVVTTLAYDKKRSFKVRNKADFPIHWGLSADSSSFTNPVHVINPKSTTTKQSSTMAIIGDILLFQNPSTTKSAEIEVRILV